MITYTQYPEQVYTLLARRPRTVLLQTSRFDEENYRSYLFCEPVEVLATARLDEVADVYAQAEEALRQGAYVAGFVSYECGEHFEPGTARAGLGPLVWFGVYPRAYIFDHRCGEFVGGAPDGLGDTDWARRAGDHPSKPEIGACRGPRRARRYDFGIRNVHLEIPRDEYERKIEAIREYICAGDTYQINFTDKLSFDFEGEPVAMFAALQERQRVAYSAYIDMGETIPPCLPKTQGDKGGPPRENRRDKGGAPAGGVQILSFSPELFFRVRDGRIATRPMKGTLRRGRDRAEDAARAEWLRNDPKNRAENVMIVDLLRNDLGRICEFGSVRVDDLFAVEQYETLLQMTSTISGRLRPGLRCYDIFKALFPCGSVTGAPKVRSMQIIRELERGPRGVYTGAIGFMSPEGEAVFNVPIRTVVLQGKRGEMGVGSGIVYDSTATEEYRECLLKAEFLTSRVRNCRSLHYARQRQARSGRDDASWGGLSTEPALSPDTRLIESILWDDGYPLLALHMERLEASGTHFGYAFDRCAIVERLQRNEAALQRGSRYKVRLLLDASGEVTIENTELTESVGTGRVMLAEGRTSSSDIFLQHKTTRRQLYDRMYQQAREHGLDDVIFMNERGEITEGAISNVFVEAGAWMYTPPVHCGLLPGVYRRHLLETNAAAAEKVLRLADLQAADAIYICNAVRGLRRVELNCALAP